MRMRKRSPEKAVLVSPFAYRFIYRMSTKYSYLNNKIS
jgi:hypothetical protein